MKFWGVIMLIICLLKVFIAIYVNQLLKVNFDTHASVYISLCSHINFATLHICEAFIIFCHYF